MVANYLYDNSCKRKQARPSSGRSSGSVPFDGGSILLGKSLAVCIYEGGLSARIQEGVIAT